MNKVLAFISLILITAVIYQFSSQTYEEQTLVPFLQKVLYSQPFEGQLSRVEVPYGGNIVSVETHGYYWFLEFLFRKMAHLVLFGCLGVVLFLVMLMFTRRRVFLSFCLSLLGTGLYAIFDEYHQLYTGGRNASIYDVLIDLSGAGIALVVFIPFYMWKRKNKKR